MKKPNNPYQAYSKAAHTVAKTRQVVMLYEGVLRYLQQARQAIENKDIQTRYNTLIRASEILIGMQVSLDFDAGQESAQALYDFYASLDARIMQLHRSQSLSECEAIIAEVRAMHEVWNKIDRGETSALEQAAPKAPAENAPASEGSGAQPPEPGHKPEAVTFSA